MITADVIIGMPPKEAVGAIRRRKVHASLVPRRPLAVTTLLAKSLKIPGQNSDSEHPE